MKLRPQLERCMILRCCFRGRARFEIEIADIRMRVCEACGRRCGEAPFGLLLEVTGALEGLLRLVIATEVLQHERTIDVGFDVIGVGRECLIQLAEGFLRTAEEDEAQPRVVAYVCESRML